MLLPRNQFDSNGEYHCYLNIVNTLPNCQIFDHRKILLNSDPSINFEIDFQVFLNGKCICFIEYKGWKASRGVWQLYRTKLAWYLTKKNNSIPYFLVFDNSTKKLPKINGIQVINLSQLPTELKKLTK